MAINRPKEPMNFALWTPIKRLVESFARSRGISMAAAASQLLVKGLKAEGVDTSSLDDAAQHVA